MPFRTPIVPAKMVVTLDDGAGSDGGARCESPHIDFGSAFWATRIATIIQKHPWTAHGAAGPFYLTMDDILGTIHPRLQRWVFSEVSIIKAVEAAGWVYVRPKGDHVGMCVLDSGGSLPFPASLPRIGRWCSATDEGGWMMAERMYVGTVRAPDFPPGMDWLNVER